MSSRNMWVSCTLRSSLEHLTFTPRSAIAILSIYISLLQEQRDTEQAKRERRPSRSAEDSPVLMKKKKKRKASSAK